MWKRIQRTLLREFKSNLPFTQLYCVHISLFQLLDDDKMRECE